MSADLESKPMETEQGAQDQLRPSRRRTPARLARRLWRSPPGLLGVVITFAVIFAAVFAPVVAPFDPLESNYDVVLVAPGTAGHVLGTDELGRDVLSRLIFGARISLAIGLSTVVIAGALGTLLGMLAGYYGGWLDTVIMRIVDIQLSFPFILLALTINAIMGIGLRNIIISLVLAGWVIYARVARGETVAMRDHEFVESARAIGSQNSHILARYVLPNILTPIIIISTLQVAQFIVAEAAISFLGFGVQPPTPAWGNMMAKGREMLYFAPWVITWPGLALALTSLGINLAGDWIRDTFDPRLEQ